MNDLKKVAHRTWSPNNAKWGQFEVLYMLLHGFISNSKSRDHLQLHDYILYLGWEQSETAQFSLGWKFCLSRDEG